MTDEPASNVSSLTPLEQLQLAREIIRAESAALEQVGKRLDVRFCSAIEIMQNCRGNVIVSGVGKAGLVGQKIAATLASTGTPSHFVHPSEAIHGDLGRIGCEDCVLLLSKSGETEEVTRLLPILKHSQTPVLAITCNTRSRLAQNATVVIDLGELHEACTLGLAPSTSTTAMIALGDALALVISRARGFTSEDFASRHPGGSLGLQLANVEEVMRPIDQCRVADESKTVRNVFVEAGRPGRRTGAIILVGHDSTVQGVFTDSDLARLFESKRDDILDVPIRQVMSCSPITVQRGVKIAAARRLMTEHRISELPVVDQQDRPVGLIDITDLIALPGAPSTVANDESGTGDERGSGDEPATVLFEQRQRAS